jgi:ABC-type antimicrobial peptide transport system permease subunit
MKIALSCLSFLLSLALGLLTLIVFFYCVLPWSKAPDRTHVTMFVAGLEFTSWRILIPMICFALAAIIASVLGIWILKNRKRVES